MNKGDIHLVGEFVECLRIFGVADNSSLIMNGVHMLIEEQNKDGSWDNHMTEFNVDEAYIAYHATMVAIQALIPSVFSGFGCMNEETEEILSSWYKSEVLCVSAFSCSFCNVSPFLHRFQTTCVIWIVIS